MLSRCYASLMFLAVVVSPIVSFTVNDLARTSCQSIHRDESLPINQMLLTITNFPLLVQLFLPVSISTKIAPSWVIAVVLIRKINHPSLLAGVAYSMVE
jgi:hypothetical protein